MKQLRMVRKMVIGAAAASMVLAASPAWAENALSDDMSSVTATGSQTGTNTSTTTNTNTTTNAITNVITPVKTKFPDVKSDHWALQHITKLAIEGIVEGDQYGNYNPEDAVSQQDVLIMAVRMMGAEAEAKSSTVTAKLPFDVDNYAQQYVIEAISKGLITIKEETDASTSDKSAWGSRPATREWVAKIMVRMLGKEADATNLAVNATSFTDNASISTWATGFVNEAVALGLVQGFEDGSFQPQGSITRAQMATFLSRSEKISPVKSPRYAKGYVSTLGGGKLVLQDLDGNTTTYNVDADTVFYGKKEGERIASNSIQQTYEVSILQVGGKAYYVEVTNDQLQMDVYTGTLFSVDTANLRLYLLVGDNPQVYDLASDVAVTDANGQGSSLSALVKNSVVELRHNRLLKTDKISQVVIKQVPVNKTSEGTIQVLNRDTKEFKILDKSSGQIESYSLGGLVNVQLQGGGTGDLGSLHVGDTVTYTVENSQLTAVTVTKQIDIGLTDQGTVVKGFAPSSGVINIQKVGGALAAYYLSDTVRVYVDGKVNAGLNDISGGDTVQLELLNNKVQTITVTNSTIQNLVFASIVSYDTSTKYLTIQDNNGIPNAYKMTDQTAIMMYGVAYTLANFSTTFLPGKKVDIQVDKDKNVTSITMSTQLSGVLTAINPATKQFTIKTGGQTISFTMSFVPQIEMYGKTTATLSDLQIGDSITLDVNPSQQDLILKITAVKTMLYKVVLTNVNARQLTLQDFSGTSTVVTLDSSATLIVPGKANPVFSDIPTDEYVRMSFKGNAVTKAEVIVPVRGKVLAVDAAAGTLTVQDFGGQTQLITIGANAVIYGAGNVPTTLAGIKANDRVQVMKDVDDKTTVQVAIAAQKTYGSYNTVLNQLTFTTTTGSDTYTLYQRAYLHQGTQAMTIGSFTAGNTVTIYSIDNRVIEMEKQ